MAQPWLWPELPFLTPVGLHAGIGTRQRASSYLFPSLPRSHRLQLPVGLAPRSPDWTLGLVPGPQTGL